MSSGFASDTGVAASRQAGRSRSNLWSHFPKGICSERPALLFKQYCSAALLAVSVITGSSYCEAAVQLPSYSHLLLATQLNTVELQASESMGDQSGTLYSAMPGEYFGDGSRGTYSRARASGFTRKNALDFLGVEAMGETDAQQNSAGGESYAQWRDIAFVAGDSQYSSIRLNFEVTGTLEINGSSSVGRISVNRNTDVSSWSIFDDGEPINATLRGFAYQDLSGFQYEGWDSLNYTLNGNRVDFVATTHIDAIYDPEYEGYKWRIVLSASAGTSWNGNFDQPGTGIDGKSSSMRSLGFTSATDADGNLLDVTFASGLSASSVPEPASITAWCLMGGVIAVAHRRRRRVLQA